MVLNLNLKVSGSPWQSSHPKSPWQPCLATCPMSASLVAALASSLSARTRLSRSLGRSDTSEPPGKREPPGRREDAGGGDGLSAGLAWFSGRMPFSDPSEAERSLNHNRSERDSVASTRFNRRSASSSSLVGVLSLSCSFSGDSVCSLDVEHPPL